MPPGHTNGRSNGHRIPVVPARHPTDPSKPNVIPTKPNAIPSNPKVIPTKPNVIPTRPNVIPAEAGTQDSEGAQPDANPKTPPPVDVEAARKSMARMANIFREIALHAENQSLERCPYKDAKSRCTAKFGCDNQHFTKNPFDKPACTAKDGDLNYRSAWHTD